jgi:uncharacterized membrane protein (UPF0127 family)
MGVGRSPTGSTPLRALIDESPLARIDSAVGRIVLRWVIGVVLVFGLLGCVVKGADNPADPYQVSSGSRAGIGGDFGETKISVKNGDQLLEWCLLLAANAAQRERGLMQITDPALGGYDGMLFRYDHDVTEAFWMRNTPMPLSIAYVGAGGTVVTAVDMTPCADDPGCPPYPAAGPYRFTIEVPQGKLPALGIVQGAVITDEKTVC